MLTENTNIENKQNKFNLCGNLIHILGDLKDFDIAIDIKKIEEDLGIAKITLNSLHKAIPPQIILKWNLPSSNIAGVWSSSGFTNKTLSPDWWPTKVSSMIANEAPIITLFGHDDKNRQTFAVSDAINTVVSSAAIREEDGVVYNSITLFSQGHKEGTSFEVELRLDTRPLLYSKSIQEVGKWWSSFEIYKPMAVPKAAYMPVYSTWYSYHQNLSETAILKECKLAKEMGFGSVIVDDGWQTLDGNRGYAYTGDWEPERLTGIKELVKQVHDIGMKFILWYAVPFVGENSKAYEKMKGKFLRYWEGQGTYILDPRFLEVREFIIETYVSAVKQWDLDGFKLDFVARFQADKNTILKALEGRDFASVNEATDVLMSDLANTLKSIKPDILIEFRQPYCGPAMLKYGNMFRAADCPNLPLINRIRTTDLRFLSGLTAVHADMLMWHYEEPVEIAALQLLNAFFSVPQISVRLEDIPSKHFNMIKFYIKYWLDNREILLRSEFSASKPLANYNWIAGWNSNKKIVAIFDDMVIPFKTSINEFDLINATTSTNVILDIKGDEKFYQYVIKTCMGEEVKREKILLKEGVFKFAIPKSGLISFSEEK